MGAYSTFTIDGVDVSFDPDSISVSEQNLVGINRSMGGTTYITSVNSNTPATGRTVTIGGALLTTTSAGALLTSSAKKTPVVVAGGDGSFRLVGFASPAKFIINSLTLNPTKPRVDHSGNTGVKYSYSISMTRVD